jgi:hypothetical protein
MGAEEHSPRASSISSEALSQQDRGPRVSHLPFFPIRGSGLECTFEVFMLMHLWLPEKIH